MAKHLRPAFIRLAGISTEFVRYIEESDEDNSHAVDTNSLAITPSMWFGVNEWLSLSQLMPIFGINDADTTRNVWNPKPMLPLFEISDKLNISCYWQLGFGKIFFMFLIILLSDMFNFWRSVHTFLHLSSSFFIGQTEI